MSLKFTSVVIKGHLWEIFSTNVSNNKQVKLFLNDGPNL